MANVVTPPAVRAPAIGPARRRVPGPALFVLVAVLYALATWRMTEPVASLIGRAVPGYNDAYSQTWAMWWTKYALLDLRRSPFVTDYMFHPLSVNLSVDVFVGFHSLLSIPLQLLFGLTPALTLLYLTDFVLNGVCAFYFVRQEVRSSWAAFVGGFVFQFAPRIFTHSNYGHYSHIAIWTLPLLAMTLRRALATGSPRAGLLAGVCWALTASIDPQKGAFAAVLVAILVLGELVGWGLTGAPGGRAALPRLVRSLVPTVLALLVVYSPHLIYGAPVLLSGQGPKADTNAAFGWSPDLLGFVIPTTYHPVLWPIFKPFAESIKMGDPLKSIFLGYTAIVLALVGLVTGVSRARSRFVWWIVFLLFASLTLGPWLQIGGTTEITPFGPSFRVPMPFQAFALIPVLGAIRFPGYFFPMTQLGLAVLAAAGVRGIVRRLPAWPLRAVATGLVGGLVLFDGLALPLGMSGAEPPAYYAQIAAEPGDFAVVELPLAWKDGYGGIGDFFSELQFFATAHRKPLVNGFASRVPRETFAFFEKRTELQYLMEPEKPPPPEARNAEAVQRSLKELGARYVFVHPGRFRLQYEEYLSSVGLRQVHKEERVTAYLVPE